MAVVLGALVCLASPATAQILGPELVTNGNMESGGPSPTPPSSWLAWNATIDASTDVPSGGGSQSLWIRNDGTGSIDGEGYQNGIAMSSGKTYRFQFDHKRSSASAGLYASLVPLNGDATTFADIPSIGSSWAHYSYDWTATGTTTTSFQVNFFPNGVGESILIDNVSIREVIPEPASMALVLGGLGVLALRRRRHSAC